MPRYDLGQVDQTACPHMQSTAVASTMTPAGELHYVRCNRCGAGLVLTLDAQQDITERAMTALELSTYGEGGAHWLQEDGSTAVFHEWAVKVAR